MRSRAIVTAVLMSLVLAACQVGAPPTSTPASTPAAPTTTAPSGAPSAAPSLQGVTLSLWAATGSSDAEKKLIERFEQETGATIDFVETPDPFEQNLLTRWATGDRPDVLQFHPITPFLVQLRPEETLRDLSGEEFLARTLPGIVDYAGNYNGKAYAQTWNFPSVAGVFYNKDVFSRLDLAIPKGWEEMLGLCDKIRASDPSIDPLFGGFGDQWMTPILPSLLWSDDVKAGVIENVNAGTAKLSDANFVQGLTDLQAAVDRGCFNKDLQTATYDGEVDALATGKAAMVIQASWLVPSLLDAFGAQGAGDKVGFFGLSRDGNGTIWTTDWTTTFMLPKTGDATREAAALEFLRWVAGPSYAAYLSDLSGPSVFSDVPDPADMQPIWQEVKSAMQAHNSPWWSSVLDAPYGELWVNLTEMLAGTKTPQQVGDQFQSDYERAKAASQ